MNLIIDIGNTSAKLAVFEQNKLKDLKRSSSSELLTTAQKLLSKFPMLSKVLIVAVTDLPNGLVAELSQHTRVSVLDREFKMPFENSYKTPETLGLDRLALVAAATQQFPKKNTLIVDAGTCITYDFVTAKAQYLGGAISPGLQMRYKALHNYTAKLPLLEPLDLTSYIGTTTAASIHSGVVNGIIQEIQGVISSYSSDYPDLTVILTGGDANFLCKQFKISIFANSNFLLEGLNFLLEYNSN
jgi:type III pantothenate kinase